MIEDAAGRTRGAEELKEIKVRIPIGYHIRLHSIRLMLEQNISETVQKALETYFELLRQEQGEERPDAQDCLDSYAEESALTEREERS